jgi:hypothetical protein
MVNYRGIFIILAPAGDEDGNVYFIRLGLGSKVPAIPHYLKHRE